MSTSERAQRGETKPLFSQRYLLVLTGVALLLLVAGVLLRPKHAPPPPVSESEGLRIQMLAQRRELERRTQYFSVAARDLLALVHQARVRPASVPSEPPRPGERLILLTSARSGEPLWVDTTAAGPAPAPCGGMTLDTVALPAPLARAFANGAAFNLDNELVGLAYDCGDRTVLLTPEEYGRQLAHAAERDLYAAAGIKTRLETDAGGARVLQVRTSTQLAAAGLEPGDLIVRINDQPVTSTEQLAALAGHQKTTAEIQRDGRRVVLQFGADATPSGIRWSSARPGARILDVAANSPASKWGLHSGDVVVKMDRTRSPSPATLDAALVKSPPQSLIVLRDDAQLLLGRSQ